MASNVSILGVPGLNLVDTLSTPYGLKGEVTPEIALEQQALNRRQQIANLLIQRGLQPRQGQMAGRFYVAPSPVQGLADLATIAAGAYGTHLIDQQRQDLAQQDRDTLANAVRSYTEKTQGTPAATVPAGVLGPERPAMPATAESKRQALIEAMTSKIPGLQQFAVLQSQQEMQAARDAAERQQAMDLAKFKAEEAQKLKAVPSADVLAKIDVEREGMGLRERLAKEEMELRTKLHAEPSGSALANVSAQGAIAMQAHQDRMAQFEQNKRQDAAMLDMKRGQYASDEAYRRDKLAMEERHKQQEFALDRERNEIQKMFKEQGKTPPGYRQTPEGNLEAIPGGPADVKKEAVFNQDTAMLQSTSSDLDRLAESANQILNHPGLAGITGIRGSIPDVPGTQAADARALLNKLKSQVAFSVLQNMRNNSKTGGALGNVSDAEGKRLEANLGSVESAQSIDQMKRELQSIIEYANGAKDRLRNAFNLKHKTGPTTAPAAPTSPAPTTAPSGAAPFHDPEKERRYQEWKSQHK